VIISWINLLSAIRRRLGNQPPDTRARVRAQPAIAFDCSIARALLRVRALFSGMISTRWFPIARKDLNLIPGNSRCSRYNRRLPRTTPPPLPCASPACTAVHSLKRNAKRKFRVGSERIDKSKVSEARRREVIAAVSSGAFRSATSTEQVDIPHRVQNLPIYYGRKESTLDRNVKNDSRAVRGLAGPARAGSANRASRGKDSLSASSFELMRRNISHERAISLAGNYLTFHQRKPFSFRWRSDRVLPALSARSSSYVANV